MEDKFDEFFFFSGEFLNSTRFVSLRDYQKSYLPVAHRAWHRRGMPSCPGCVRPRNAVRVARAPAKHADA